MNSIIESTPNFLNLFDSLELMEYSGKNLSNYIFDMANKYMDEQQTDIMRKLAEAVPALAQMIGGLKKDQKLKLVFSDEVLRKIKDKTYRLMESKDAVGTLKAIVVDEKGTIKSIPDLIIKDVVDIDVANITTAMQGAAIQQQLRAIAEQLNDISESIGSVLIGQHNDRIALYYSAEAMYREAMSIRDLGRQKEMISAAILALTNAVASLQVSLAHDIDEICDKYDMNRDRFVGIKTEQIKEKMYLINSAFQTIHNSMALKAAIYYREGEYAALSTTLQDYKLFLESSLSERTAHVLYLADPNEKSLAGIWNMRQNELPEQIDLVRLQLSSPTEYAIEANKEIFK